jgi:cytochrome c oxidase subunit 2
MDSSSRLAGLLFATAVVACGPGVHSVGNIFDPQATPAESTYNVSMLMLAICAAIFVVVGGFVAFTIVRYRRREKDDSREPAQVYGSNRIEIAWTVIPVLIVLVLTIATARVVVEVQNRRMPAGALQVTVIGHQWWWGSVTLFVMQSS